MGPDFAENWAVPSLAYTHFSQELKTLNIFPLSCVKKKPELRSQIFINFCVLSPPSKTTITLPILEVRVSLLDSGELSTMPFNNTPTETYKRKEIYPRQTV